MILQASYMARLLNKLAAGGMGLMPGAIQHAGHGIGWAAKAIPSAALGLGKRMIGSVDRAGAWHLSPTKMMATTIAGTTGLAAGANVAKSRAGLQATQQAPEMNQPQYLA